jgi:hypothetical protein
MVNPDINKGTAPMSAETQKLVEAFEDLGTDQQLALLYYIYEKMGDSITPAAPGAANPELAPTLLGDYLNLGDDEQLQIMRDIVEGKDTEWSRLYGGLKPNNQLVVWYSWAVEMGKNVVDIPANYEANEASQDILKQIQEFEFEQQITVLRQIVSDMGYSDVQAPPSQEETGKTPSL